jgi:probable O-glycosylation ligase (exosortase A-associated)
MRDLAIMMVLPILLYTGFKRPFIGLGLWLWSSAININAIVYGFATSITFAKLFAGLTIFSFFISKEKKEPTRVNALTLFIILFYIVTTLSNIGAISDVDLAWERWGMFSKIIIFYLFAIAIIRKKIHFDTMIWILIISIGAMSAKEGVKFLASGGAHRIGGLAGIQGDNNFFGVMIITVIPLAGYILNQTKDKILKMGVLVVIIFMVLGIFSTFSRGAFVGLSIFAISFWKNSKNKMLWGVALVGIVFTLSNVMPDTWLDRMNTVEKADQDSSFMGRVAAWKIGTLIAMDHIFGGGFNCVESTITWNQYALQYYKLDFVPPLIATPHYHATHSIYFQVLSNHGFIGLSLFLMILLTAYFKVSKITASKNTYSDWIISLAKMIKLSLISYCVSGGLVNVAYFDFLYAIFAMIVTLEMQIKLPTAATSGKRK